jgi:hypothetical protein
MVDGLVLNQSIMVNNENMIFRSPYIKLDHIRSESYGFFKRFDRILVCIARGTTVSND